MSALPGLQYDPDVAVRELSAADPVLAALIERAGPFTMRPEVTHDLFTYLTRSIIFQQLAGAAARTIHGRFLDLWPDAAHPTPADVAAASPELLRTAGISANKARALHDLADRAMRGELPTIDVAQTMTDDELETLLTAVRGVGPWTVHMLLMFHLGRPDVLPVGDYGVRAGYAKTYGLPEHPTPGQLRSAAEPWRPYRSVASWYMYRAVDLSD